jgi:hypothetical protein
MGSEMASGVQRRSAMSPLKTTCAVLAAGLLAAACTTAPEPDGTATATPSISPTTTATPGAETPSASPSVTPSPTQGGPLGDAAECENEELGYEVEYPGDWWANERIEPESEDLTPIPACQFFGPSEVELQPNAGLPNGTAIRFEIPEDMVEPPDDEIVSDEERTVADRDARVIETEPAPQEGFVPEGSLVYQYIIELADGRQLVAVTDNILQDDQRYAESKAILDAMMETLEIED